MRLLKIELQNINSLKSKSPIVIDFENDKFKDVGLFIISGSTGAGKTTILDAITIAMYHNVPRFNKSFIKAGLEDVVSYSANDAMSRVTFENKGVRYEAQWSIRLISKNGKKLNTPIEEVRLKNLTNDRIIAEKKREVQSEIENITQLKYDQFLRSVVLAQGEFAAFLSANAKDKGTLLEQITGEEIYKKIGESINRKLYDERRILDNIKAKINTEDILSNEERSKLYDEQNFLKKDIQILRIESSQTKSIIDWYKKNIELQNEQKQLETKKQELIHHQDKNKAILSALNQHNKAFPFKEKIDEVTRIEKEIQIKNTEIQQLKKSLESINSKINEIEKQEKISKETYTNNERNIKEWLPKLEDVSKLDTSIENKKKSKEKTINEVYKVSIIQNKIQQKLTQKQLEFKQKKIILTEIQSFINDNKTTPKIERELSDWNSKLTLRKNYIENIVKDTKRSNKIEKELNDAYTNLSDFKKSFEIENQDLSLLEKDFEEVTNLLKSNDLDGLLSRQRVLDEEKQTWTKLQDLSTDYHESSQTKKNLDTDKNNLDIEAKNLEGSFIIIKSKIKEAQKSLHDAEKIYELERTIKSFSEERKKLEKNKPCQLCGSKDHPLVQKYEEIEFSNSKREFERRKLILDNFKKNEKEIEIDITKINSKIETNIQQTLKINSQIIEVENSFLSINPEIKISNKITIENKTILLEEDIHKLKNNIDKAQKLQKQKDEKAKLLTLKKTSISNLTNEIGRLEEKISANKSSLDQKFKDLETLNNKTKALENYLVTKMSEFNLKIPIVDNTLSFIKRIEDKILSFNLKTNELVQIKGEILKLEEDIKNSKDNLNDKNTEREDYKKELELCDKNLLQLSNDRNAILPLNLTTELKRSELQNTVKTSKKQLDQITQSLNSLITKRATNEKEQVNTIKEISLKTKLLSEKLPHLEKMIIDSDFSNRQEIMNAFLSYDISNNYADIKGRLEERAIELSTLQSKLKTDFNKQENEKKSDIPYDKALETYNEFESRQDKLLNRDGEIKNQLDKDNEIKQRNKNVFEDISSQENVLKKWNDLMLLLGGSKHAFNTYVQRLTLRNLIQLANIHLIKLNPRYSLKMNETYKPGEELNFKLIDHYQTDQERLVDTSSGGEKFLISLALALGLSDLASYNVNIKSLFIDEGFGTLDNNTLETVISTLETLQAQGKMIGIISHVENLKERIPTQIKVLKKRNGVSEIQIV